MLEFLLSARSRSPSMLVDCAAEEPGILLKFGVVQSPDLTAVGTRLLATNRPVQKSKCTDRQRGQPRMVPGGSQFSTTRY